MTEVLNRSKSTEWTRAFVGGLLSALVVGILLRLLTFAQSLSSGITFLLVILDLPGILLHTWLFGDPFAKFLPLAEADVISWRIIWLTLVCWFLFGFVLTYFGKNQRKAFAGWSLTIMVLAVLVILLNG